LFVDTPGTNAIVAHHQAITEQVIPRSDLVLFVTSAERPITDSEASFLKRIGQWGKKVILVVNKVDLLESREEQEQVLTFVAQNAAHILGRTEPLPIFGVSGKVALRHKMMQEKFSNSLTGSIEASGEGGGSWEKGNLVSLERYLLKVLGKEEIIHNKLLNPLNIADRVIQACDETIHARKHMLDGDNRVLEFINENMEVFMEGN
jgi:tRNA U34 5-carboxymethylaminomethyl modifying GTPase MnmE/TrmE